MGVTVSEATRLFSLWGAENRAVGEVGFIETYTLRVADHAPATSYQVHVVVEIINRATQEAGFFRRDGWWDDPIGEDRGFEIWDGEVYQVYPQTVVQMVYMER